MSEMSRGGRIERCALIFLLLGLVETIESKTGKNNKLTSGYGLTLAEGHKSATKNSHTHYSSYGRTPMERNDTETEKKNTLTKSYGHNSSINMNKNETRVVFLEATAGFGNKNTNNNNKFVYNDYNTSNNNMRKVKKRSIEPDEGDPRIVSLDYELINEVWPQEFIDEYKKNKQGMSGCQFPVLSVFCCLTCLFPVII